MAKFANECLTTMHTLTRQLEVALGPDTNELVLRVGLHSGPVVAGVLRGEKSRFQLFGDTVRRFFLVVVVVVDVGAILLFEQFVFHDLPINFTFFLLFLIR